MQFMDFAALHSEFRKVVCRIAKDCFLGEIYGIIMQKEEKSDHLSWE